MPERQKMLDEITTKRVMELREQTGMPVLFAKKILKMTNGDIEEAKSYYWKHFFSHGPGLRHLMRNSEGNDSEN